MKAIVVKNDDFKTIGFEVTTTTGERVFSWGISAHSNVWTKEVSFEKNAEAIFELKALGVRLAERESFVTDWFDVVLENNINEKMQKAGIEGIKFEKNKKQIEQLEKQIERLINTIK